MTDSPVAEPAAATTSDDAAMDAAPPSARIAEPGPPPPRPGGAPAGWDRFFGWVSGLGVVRADGWLGGVCAGVATRIGVDPIIVRGIFAVAALFGLPVMLVYAVGWALLPDLSGRIHLRELIRRQFDPAMIGIGVMLLLSFVPMSSVALLPFGFVFGWTPWGDWSAEGFLSTLLIAGLIAGAVVLLLWASRRTSSSPAPDARTASAASGGSSAAQSSASGAAVPAAADPAAAHAPAGSDRIAPAPAPPVAPAPDASGDDLASWRAQHEAWRQQDDAWRRQQRDAERLAREQARAERAAAGAVFAAEAAERRRVRRASNPRTSVVSVVFVLGAALVAGAGAALWHVAVEPGEPLVSVAIGLFSAGFVVAVSMILAGALRRRSGFLAFLAVVLLVAGGATAIEPTTRGVAFGSTYVTNDSPRSFTHLWGDLSIDAHDVGGTPDPIVVDKRGGWTSITVGAGVIVDLEVTGLDSVDWSMVDINTGEWIENGVWESSAGSDDPVVHRRIDNSIDGQSPTHQRIELAQSSGSVSVTIYQD